LKQTLTCTKVERNTIQSRNMEVELTKMHTIKDVTN